MFANECILANTEARCVEDQAQQNGASGIKRITSYDYSLANLISESIAIQFSVLSG